jgi:hypothetical protein
MSDISDYKYFVDNLQKLYEEYGHKFLAIKSGRVVGVYDDFESAFDEMTRKEKLGTFLIQECVPSEADLVQSFQSNVGFETPEVRI